MQIFHLKLQLILPCQDHWIVLVKYTFQTATPYLGHSNAEFLWNICKELSISGCLLLPQTNLCCLYTSKFCIQPTE